MAPKLLALATAILLIAAGTAAAQARLTLTGMEPYFMCATCHEPLMMSQSPQAQQERSYLSGLIARGETKAQIEAAMVSQYGTTVLAVPKAQGFNLLFYIVPPLLVLAGIATLAVLLPRWRRRARSAKAADAPSAPPPFDPADARRLEEELARYEG
jgi:cytochrome c-type biogenesis protein CcmH